MVHILIQTVYVQIEHKTVRNQSVGATRIEFKQIVLVIICASGVVVMMKVLQLDQIVIVLQ